MYGITFSMVQGHDNLSHFVKQFVSMVLLVTRKTVFIDRVLESKSSFSPTPCRVTSYNFNLANFSENSNTLCNLSTQVYFGK